MVIFNVVADWDERMKGFCSTYNISVVYLYTYIYGMAYSHIRTLHTIRLKIEWEKGVKCEGGGKHSFIITCTISVEQKARKLLNENIYVMWISLGNGKM